MRGLYYIQLQWHSPLLNKTFVWNVRVTPTSVFPWQDTSPPVPAFVVQ